MASWGCSAMAWRPTLNTRAPCGMPSSVNSLRENSPASTSLRDSSAPFTSAMRRWLMPFCMASGSDGNRWPPDLICERFKVLRDGCEMELVARTGEASQSHALEAMVNLQVGKTHFHFFALIARLL